MNKTLSPGKAFFSRRLRIDGLIAALLVSLISSHAWEQASAASSTVASTAPHVVIARGKVPDDATRLAILDKLRGIYGVDGVNDQLQIASVSAPPDWPDSVQRLIDPSIKAVRSGRLSIDGTNVELAGIVDSEAARQQLADALARSANPAYRMSNLVRVNAPAAPPAAQNLLDQTLANRTIAFETGSAKLTPQSSAILDQMAVALARLDSGSVQIIGHTDNAGSYQSNLDLSAARAATVKNYLSAKGIPENRLKAMGLGPAQPLASNSTEEGRALNRRIEFRFVR